MLRATGHDEISLLSLSSGDYSRIEPLLTTLMDRYYARRVALALPSLRAETLTPQLIEGIRRVRKTSFTLAPEAGTQRLRDVDQQGQYGGGAARHDGTGLRGRLEGGETLLHARPSRRAGGGPGGDRRTRPPGPPDGEEPGSGHGQPFDLRPETPHPLPVAAPDRHRRDSRPAGVFQEAPEEPEHQRQMA